MRFGERQLQESARRHAPVGLTLSVLLFVACATTQPASPTAIAQAISPPAPVASRTEPPGPVTHPAPVLSFPAASGYAGALRPSSIESVTVYFDTDSSALPPTSLNSLAELAESIKPLTVAGHCDERGTTAYNLALGQRRADAVAGYLRKMGAKSVKAISFGKERPVDLGHNDGAWLVNRRAEVTR